MTDEYDTRTSLEARLKERLAQLDEAALQRLEAWLEAQSAPGVAEEKTLPLPTATGPAAPRVSRRRFLGQLAVGGAALVATHAATAFLFRDQGQERGEAEARAALVPQLIRLQDLVALYERLEAIDLDDIVQTALGVIGPLLKTLKTGGQMLAAGLDLVESALTQLELAEAKVQEGLDFVKRIVDEMEQRVADLWRMLGEVTGVAIPIAESVGAFFKNILEKIPFGIGAKIEQIIEWITSLIGQLPDTLASIKARLLTPLFDQWFDAESGHSLDARLIHPIRQQVVQPGRQLVAEIEELDKRWEANLQRTAETAISERAAIRAEITEFRKKMAI